MNKFIKISLFLCLIFMGSGLVQSNSNETKKTHFPFYQVLPVDDAGKDLNFKNFKNQLMNALDHKDHEFLIKHIDKNIKFSFGPENGLKSFIHDWNLDKDPKKSKIWLELKDVLKLGGVIEEDGSFTYPYTFRNFPDKFDAFSSYVVTDKNVGLYTSPSFKSKIIKKLNYEIVSYVCDTKVKETENNRSYYWSKVEISSGLQGYVLEKFLRSPIDYRVMFKKIDREWKMIFFVAGD